MRYRFAFVAVVLLSAFKGFGQDPSSDSAFTSITGIVHTLYDAISGPVGHDRDWNVFRSLFAENARMYISVPDKDQGGTVLKSITPEEYADRNKTRLSDIGFNEDELYRITNAYGAGAQVFSTYESHYTNQNGEEEITQGINSMQLFFDGQRYYIASIFWDANAKDIQVPERYLPKDKNTEYQINF